MTNARRPSTSQVGLEQRRCAWGDLEPLQFFQLDPVVHQLANFGQLFGKYAIVLHRG